jgi:hypothetical protein
MAVVPHFSSARMLAAGTWVYPLSRDLLKLNNVAWPPTWSSTQPLPILIWFDTLRDRPAEFYHHLCAGQIVNRIPRTNLLCRKTTFARLIDRASEFAPDDFNFVPKSYLFPAELNSFNAMIEMAKSKGNSRLPKFIIKPEYGALGARISILPAGTPCDCREYAVVQEYIEPKLADGPGPVPRNTKFDFRIYTLIKSVDPLEVYVYREGLTRICAETYDKNTNFARLTNTAVNKRAGVPLDSITKSLIQTFEQLYPVESTRKRIWQKIKDAILLSVIAAVPYLGLIPDEADQAVLKDCRCFQILGFDVLLDAHDKPYVIEVNYRPSLSRDTKLEEKLKLDLLIDTLWIVLPHKKPSAKYENSWKALWALIPRDKHCGFEKLTIDGRFQKIHEAIKQHGCTWEKNTEYGGNMPGKRMSEGQ